jgi:hypothetical protein
MLSNICDENLEYNATDRQKGDLHRLYKMDGGKMELKFCSNCCEVENVRRITITRLITMNGFLKIKCTKHC